MPAAAARRIDPLLALAAAGLIAASAAALAAEAWWGFELLAHFRVQYLALQAPLVLALLARRRLAWCAALGASAVPNALPVLPYLVHDAPAAEAARAADAPLELLEVNVQAGNRSYARLREIVMAESPDVLLVVELTQAWAEALRPLFRLYPHRVLRPAGGAFGVGLLSRYPLEAAHAFELGSTHAVDARVLSPQGAFRLIGVHLRPPTAPGWAAERERQLDALAALRARIHEPLVVAGDFNLTPYSPYFADWTAETGLRDARRAFGLGLSWPTFLPILGIPIDHCVVSKEVTVVGFKRLPAFGSDHYPILIELQTGSSA
ncbi:MAG TPA: endonuclease/exonuclease/phosphatase family protein [Gammaproteobacteria bacterium]